jgi:hypothetical protein
MHTRWRQAISIRWYRGSCPAASPLRGLIGYAAGMPKFTLKRLFVSVSLIAMGIGLLGILFRPWAYAPPIWVGRPLWFFGEAFIGIGILSLFSKPLFLGGTTGLVIALIAGVIPNYGETVRIAICITAMLLAMAVYCIAAKKELQQKSLAYRFSNSDAHQD